MVKSKDTTEEVEEEREGQRLLTGNPDDAAEEKLPAKRKRTQTAKAAVENNEGSDSDYEDSKPPAKKQRKGAAKKSGRGRQNKLTNGTKSSKALPLDAMVRKMILQKDITERPNVSNVAATGDRDGVPFAESHAELLQHVQVPSGGSDHPDGRRFRAGARRVRPSVYGGTTEAHGRQVFARPLAFAPAANLQR